METVSAVWEGLSERRKAALFATIMWLLYGLIIRVWED